MTLPILTYRETGRPITPKGAGDGDPVVRLDLARIVTSRLLIQANSGGGKSWALRQLLEETYGRIPQIILDPEGEFYTLREMGDYVLAAKSGGDVEASVKTAKTLCRRLVELRASAVIDLYEMKLAERREFIRVFLTEMVNLPRALWHPTLVPLDEAHMYCPERGHGEAESTDAVIGLATLGRKRGFALVAATGRLSKLNKDLAAELNTKIIGRTGLDVDVKRAGDELGFGKEDRAQLSRLEPGTFFVYGPALPDGAMVHARTGGVRTTHPEPGQLAAAAPPASSKVKALIASSLADLPKEAAEEAKTLEDLKRQNADLARKLRGAEKAGGERVVEKPVVDERAIARAVAVAERRAEERRASIIREFRRLTKAAWKHVADATDSAAGFRETITRAEAAALAEEGTDKTAGESRAEVQVGHTSRERAPLMTPSVGGGLQSRSTPRPVAAPPRRADAGEKIGGTPQRILNALRFLETVGTSPASRGAVGGLVGISSDTGTFRNYLSELRAGGYIVDAAGLAIALTDEGRARASDDGLPRSVDELHAAWLSKLGGTPGRMLRVLLDAYPEAVSREELGEACDIIASTGTFRNYLSELRSPGLILDVSKTAVRAADALFPEGL